MYYHVPYVRAERIRSSCVCVTYTRAYGSALQLRSPGVVSAGPVEGRVVPVETRESGSFLSLTRFSSSFVVR